MTLQSSGALNLGDVNVELTKARTTEIGLDDSDVRSLYEIPSGPIRLAADGYDKEFFAPGGLWASGFQSSIQPQLGIGTITHRSSPVQVGALTNWKYVSSSTDDSTGEMAAAAIKSDGTLWAWGSNQLGPLGQNDRLTRSSPIQIGAFTNWKWVQFGVSTWWAIKTNGELWTCGSDNRGKLAQGTAGVNKSSPVQIGALTNWKWVDGASNFAMAIKTDGTLWAWGGTAAGATGTGDLVHRSSPIQIGALTDWKLISTHQASSAAIKTNGTLWTWGANLDGRLGLGNRTDRSSPVQVGALNNWKTVSSGYDHMVAVKTDGTLWAWGYNGFGPLGNNDRVHRSSPIQIGALTDWKQPAGGYFRSAAIKTNGTLWTWGLNTSGQLGQNDRVHRSSPVQVGALTSWKYVANESGNLFAIRT